VLHNKNGGDIVRKLFLILFLTFTTCFIIQSTNSVHAQTSCGCKEKKTELTEEQKQAIQAKKEELKQKYLANYDQLSEADKKIAMKQYKEEFKQFLKEEFDFEMPKHKPKFPIPFID
jgi:LAS superfamily LD-carboxypeptidase LdcB